MTAGFAAALLQGFEGTLDAALEHIEEGELRREVEGLRIYIVRQCQKFEKEEALELMTSVP